MIYLDNAATSYPKPELVYRRVDEVLRTVAGNPGRGGHRGALEASRVVFHAREAVSRLTGIVDSSRIVFTKNATEAINIALKGLGLKPPDHIITTSFEHNSVVKTVGRLEARGVRVTRLKPDKDGFIIPGDIEAAVTETTRLVCISHASNVFGTIQPIKHIGSFCATHGIPFMVDAAQTLGAFPVDLGEINIDILAATGHKALFGPQGTGFLYVREGLEPDPLVDGGTGDLETVLEMPDRLEAGTMNTPGIGGLSAGVEFLLKEGVEKIREFEAGLMGRLLKGLEGIEGVSVIGTKDPSKRVSLVSFNMEGKNPVEAGIKLDTEHSIMVRCGTHCAPYAHRAAGSYPEGAIRVSPGYFNRPEEIDEFLRAIKNLKEKN